MTTIALWPVLACLAASFITCLLIVLTQRWHGRLSLDHDLNGVQKIHRTPVPRVGGVGVVVGLILAGGFSYQLGGETYQTAGKLLLCSVPVFVTGLVEDFTKQVGVRPRLFAAFFSAALAYWTLDAQLTKLDTPGLDQLIGIAAISFSFTCFAVGGLTNAVNIIDGLNGLASGSVALMLAGLAAIAFQAGDILMVKLCLWGIAAMVGFMLLNYPFGKIFLGDGGAYLAGFWLAECAVLLLQRNSNISTWAILLSVIYPVWETAYSMYRRQMKQKTRTGEPDSSHLHHLILKTVERPLRGFNRPWLRHGVASVLVWLLVASCQIGAYIASKSPIIGAMLTLSFASVYVLLYTAIQTQTTHSISDVDGVFAIDANQP